MHLRPRHTLGVTIPWLLASWLSATAALAQTTPEQKAAAESLFLQGRQYMEAGDFALACARFEQSEKLDSATGTLLNLADCYEKQGRLASAWATFKSAASAARRGGQSPREQLARERAASLEPRLAKLTIDVAAAAAAEGVAVTRGGVSVEKGLWGQPVPVDAGTLAIEATAPAKLGWTQTVEAVDGQTVTVYIPALELDSAASAAAPAAGSASEALPAGGLQHEPQGHRDWVLPAVVGGAGVVLLGVGGGFAMKAKSTDSDSDAHCSGDVCDREGVQLRDDAVAAGNVATALFAVGSATVVGGIVLYFARDPSEEASNERPRVWATAAAGRGGGSLSVRGSW